MKRPLIPFIIFLLILSGCSNTASTKSEKTSEGSNKLQIVTTFYPMYYFTKQVAGNSANVELLIPNGVEPHDWEPTVKDMEKIQNADVFIYNSRYFETWVDKVLKSMGSSKLKVLEATKGIQLLDGNFLDNEDKQKGNSSTKDPHVWLSPVLSQIEVDNIAKTLEQSDPKHKEQYNKNAAALKAKLVNLDHLYKETIDKANQKEFVTQHAAFQYLAKQYGLSQIPIAGLSPDVEPTLGKLSELARLTKEKNIHVVYFEGLTSSKVAQTLANEIGAKTKVLNPLEGLTSEDQKQSLDYIGVMKKNLEALKLSLNQK